MKIALPLSALAEKISCRRDSALAEKQPFQHNEENENTPCIFRLTMRMQPPVDKFPRPLGGAQPTLLLG